MGIKKRRFSLIEVMMAFFLLSILLTALMSSFRDQIFFFKKNDEKELSTMHRVMLHDKLSKIFLEIPKEGGGFYTHTDTGEKKTELYFTMNNGPNEDPQFAGLVKSKLCIHEKQLTLEITSRDTSEKQLIHLMEEIPYLQFKFLKEPGSEPVDQWDMSESQLPVALMLSFDEMDASAMYFILSQNLPTYTHKEASG